MSGDRPLRRDTTSDLTDRVMSELAERILSGALRGGEKLSEPKLARAFGVSRGPMREAVRRLQERHLITRTVNHGARVRQFSAAECLELFFIREALEGMSARLASRNMSDEAVAELLHLLQAHRETLLQQSPDEADPDPDGVEFHFRIARGSGSAQLERLLCNDLYAIYRLCWRQQGFAKERGTHAVAEHLRIAEAIAERDGDLAELLMRRHVVKARRNYERLLAAGEPVASIRAPNLEATNMLGETPCPTAEQSASAAPS
jgi:DNA-binding GntR family transcriptional regulator